jgi:hypothetical protein
MDATLLGSPAHTAPPGNMPDIEVAAVIGPARQRRVGARPRAHRLGDYVGRTSATMWPQGCS